MIISIGGGALGVLFSLWTVGALPSFFPPEQAQMLDARVDRRVFAFTFAVALSSGVLFGLVPALQTRHPNVIAGLRGESGAAQTPRGGARLRNAMVVAQVALSSVLVVSTGLLARSLGTPGGRTWVWRPERRHRDDGDPAPRSRDSGHRAVFRTGQRRGAAATRHRSHRPHPRPAALPGRPARVPLRRLRAGRRRRHGDQRQRRERDVLRNDARAGRRGPGLRLPRHGGRQAGHHRQRRARGPLLPRRSGRQTGAGLEADRVRDHRSLYGRGDTATCKKTRCPSSITR